MLKPKSPQESFYGSYLYDRIVPPDHLLRKMSQVVDFSFARQILNDRYKPKIGRSAEDPKFVLRLCLLQYIYGDSERAVVENARLSLAHGCFLGLAADAEAPDYTTVSYFRTQSLWEEKLLPSQYYPVHFSHIQNVYKYIQIGVSSRSFAINHGGLLSVS
jgi:transposase